MILRRTVSVGSLLCSFFALSVVSAPAASLAPATQPAVPLQTIVGEQVPSEDAVIKDLHSLGLVNGTVDLFRSACPVRDLAKSMSISSTQPSASVLAEARARMQHLHDLGVRTDVSFQSPTGDDSKSSDVANAINLEHAACDAVGIRFVSHPLSNSGPHSLETMTDEQVIAAIQPIVDELFAETHDGGVLFHCTAGHDRTGIVVAYIRLKYQHWSADQAIAEMRRLGHNWKKFSRDGGNTSWHEQHVRGIATLLDSTH